MSGVSALRALPMVAPSTAWSPLPPPSPLSTTLALLAIVVHLTVSANVLSMLGIHYDTDGGNPLIKFHPATYLTMAALLARLFASGHPTRTLEQLAILFPRTIIFLLMMLMCMAWMIVNVGVSGVAVYVESYFSAGVLLLVLADSGVAQRQRLGRIMLGLFVLSAAIAAVETVVHRTLEPIYLSGEVYHAVDYEFRGQGLYNHALTGSMMTEVGILLLAQMRLRPWLTVMLGLPMLLGLISFGGRTALLMTLITIICIGGYYIIRGLLDRTLRPVVLLGAIVGVVVVAALLVYVVTETSIGVRLAGKLTLDDNSSQTRNYQWLMLGQMSVNELLFGMSQLQETLYIYQLGLVYDFHIVENFWLVAFMYLGGIGFLFYLFGFLSFLVDLWKFAPLFGRAILVTTILVASTSNSIGQKSNVLFLMTAAIVATTGFARTEAARSRGGRQLAARQDPPALIRPASIMRGPASRGFEPPPTYTPPAPGQGGLLRDPATPDRALRPVRLNTTRP